MRILGSERRADRLMAVAGAIVAPLLLAACAVQTNDNPTGDQAAPGLFPGEVVTSQGREAAGLYPLIFGVAVVIFFVVEGILLYVTLRYRRRSTDTALPAQTHGHNVLEIGWTVVPALIVTGMFVWSMNALTKVEAKSDPAVTVDVTAYQFYWDFAYPDEGIEIPGAGNPKGPEMVLPVGETVRIRLHAPKDAKGDPSGVIHSFYVPQFFFKKDVIPFPEGRPANEFEVLIEKPGTYGGQCAEFCGLDHAKMFFTIRAVERAEYDAWLASTKAGAGPVVAASPAASASAEPGAEPAGLVLEIATTEDDPLAFTESTLTAPAATEVTVEYLNDSSTMHNIQFFDGPDASAPLIAATELGAGPGNLQTVTFTTPATPGSYHFNCLVHQTQMVGTLEVTP